MGTNSFATGNSKCAVASGACRCFPVLSGSVQSGFVSVGQFRTEHAIAGGPGARGGPGGGMRDALPAGPAAPGPGGLRGWLAAPGASARRRARARRGPQGREASVRGADHKGARRRGDAPVTRLQELPAGRAFRTRRGRGAQGRGRPMAAGSLASHGERLGGRSRHVLGSVGSVWLGFGRVGSGSGSVRSRGYGSVSVQRLAALGNTRDSDPRGPAAPRILDIIGQGSDPVTFASCVYSHNSRRRSTSG